ncbi:MAG: hypothetical protein R3F59_22270 [Myxococcota bacterium]
MGGGLGTVRRQVAGMGGGRGRIAGSVRGPVSTVRRQDSPKLTSVAVRVAWKAGSSSTISPSDGSGGSRSSPRAKAASAASWKRRSSGFSRSWRSQASKPSGSGMRGSYAGSGFDRWAIMVACGRGVANGGEPVVSHHSRQPSA